MALGVTSHHLQSARKYFYEKLVWTGYPFAGGTTGSSSLGTGITDLVNLTNFNSAGDVAVRAEIAALAATQHSDVAFTWSNDPENHHSTLNSGDLSAARAGVRIMPMGIKAVDTLSASLNNTSGAAIADFQGNLTVASRRLTVMDKRFAVLSGLQSTAGTYNLTEAEQEALAAANMTVADIDGLVSKGTLPYTTEQYLRLLIDTHTVDMHDDFFSVSVTSDDNPFAPYTASMSTTNNARGRFLVLDRFACEGAANVSFTILRDGDTDSYWTFNGGAFTQSDDAAWDVFLAAFNHMTIHATLGPGAANLTAGVRVRVREVEMSDILAALTGRTKKHPKVILGLLAA